MAHPFMPSLAAVLTLVGTAAVEAQTSTVTTGPNGVSGSTSVTTSRDGKPCKVVRSDGRRDGGSLSSSVTAGPDGVRASTTGGSSVTTHSGSSASASSSASSSSSDGTTVTTTSDGDCVVTVPKDKK